MIPDQTFEGYRENLRISIKPNLLGRVPVQRCAFASGAQPGLMVRGSPAATRPLRIVPCAMLSPAKL